MTPLDKSRRKKPPLPGSISQNNLDDASTLRYTWEEPTGQAQWTFVISGTKYGKPFSVHMTREGARQLLVRLAQSI